MSIPKSSLDILSSHLYVLRNQLIQCGRDLDRFDDTAIRSLPDAQNMNILIPLFTELMTDNPHTEYRALCVVTVGGSAPTRRSQLGDQNAAFVFYWIAFNAAYGMGPGKKTISPTITPSSGRSRRVFRQDHQAR